MERRRKDNKSGEKSQRQLKVGEEVRHILSTILLRDTFYEPELDGVSVTISEVSISPDFTNAAVFIVPLGGGAADGDSSDVKGIIDALRRVAPMIQQQLASQLTIRRTPRLKFMLDSSFERASRISSIISSNSREGEAD
jgi:ribosome-binding factor A